MTSFGRFIKIEREKKGLSQTELGAKIQINAPLVSRIENDKKQLSLNKIKLLALVFELEYDKVKDLYFADRFAKDAYKFKCSENVFFFAEEQTKYLKEVNTTLGKLKF